MLEPTTPTLFRDEPDDSPSVQKLACVMAIARRARDDRWAPAAVAQTMQMLGLDTFPLAQRTLATYRPDSPRRSEEPPLAPADNLLNAVLTISLADKGDRSVLAVLEATEDSTERTDLLTGRGVPPAMAAAYAGLDAALLGQALIDPHGALDGIAARAVPGPGFPGEAA